MNNDIFSSTWYSNGPPGSGSSEPSRHLSDELKNIESSVSVTRAPVNERTNLVGPEINSDKGKETNSRPEHTISYDEPGSHSLDDDGHGIGGSDIYRGY
ncbi:Protein of unknown function [Pyronema omphalodes CBS 100304]|uniref:Uncharacterized protein n=1 Tax=Pyronema omphalodes (strain CBS 100304) TaxID=1076935 RepID=U4L487_PYROM|nr:Protein of unknown function [Pyronema omphalodes CBS 100304]